MKVIKPSAKERHIILPFDWLKERAALKFPKFVLVLPALLFN